MALYQFVEHKTIELTYDVEANSLQEARRKHGDNRSKKGSAEHMEQETLGSELVMVICPNGQEIQAEDLEKRG